MIGPMTLRSRIHSDRQKNTWRIQDLINCNRSVENRGIPILLSYNVTQSPGGNLLLVITARSRAYLHYFLAQLAENPHLEEKKEKMNDVARELSDES